jgi:regulatory protein YycH of two-component signal transduction system YycFG
MKQPKYYLSKSIRQGQLDVYSWDRIQFQIDLTLSDGTSNTIKCFNSLESALEYAENY